MLKLVHAVVILVECLHIMLCSSFYKKKIGCHQLSFVA